MKKFLTAILFIFILFSISYGATPANRTNNANSTAAETPPDDSFIPDLNTPQQTQENDELAGYSLSSIIKKIIRVSPLLNANRSAEDIYKAKIKQIQAERDPTLSFETILLPIPNIPTAVAGQTWLDTINFKRWGLAHRTSFTLSLPLYTFGRTDNALTAARSGLRMEQITSASARTNLVVEIKKYYYGYLLAYSMKEYILKTVMEKLNSSLSKAEKNYKQGKGKKTDLYSLNIMKLMLQGQELEINKNLTLAQRAFKIFMEIPEDHAFKIREDIIVETPFVLRPVEDYIEMAYRNNDNYQKLQHGLVARGALMDYQRVQNNPVLFIALQAYYQSRITRIDVSGVFDNADSFRVFLGLGLRWGNNLTKQRHIISEAQAEYNKLESEYKAYKQKLPLDVRSAYMEVKTAKEKMKLAEEAFLNGKKWMLHSYRMYMIDSANTDELTAGFNQYAQTRRAYFQSIFDFNMAIANLSRLIGVELSPVRY